MTSLRREDLIRALPYARRYARALTGSQPRGDSLVAESLQEMLSDAETEGDAQHALYRTVTRRFDKLSGASSPFIIGRLSQKQRQLLLLTSLEELPIEAAAPIVAIPVKDAEAQLSEAREHLRTGAATDVLIIEDEPVIAMDIEELVQSCGHNVVGVAATEAEAVEMAERTRPGLILADINLGEGGSGIEAVNEILSSFDVPVIFVTAYPERLLTGERPEPTYLIAKPFLPETVQATVGQALFFHPIKRKAA